jgi:hypothetical protein
LESHEHRLEAESYVLSWREGLVNLSQALQLSARGMQAETARLRAMADAVPRQYAERGLVAPDIPAMELPHDTNLLEMRASRQRLVRLIGLLT